MLIALIVFDLVVAVGAFLFPRALVPHPARRRARGSGRAAAAHRGDLGGVHGSCRCWRCPRWRAAPHWLVLVCGIRLSELFADWTWLAFAEQVTPFGTAALIFTLPANLLICRFLFATYRQAVRER